DAQLLLLAQTHTVVARLPATALAVLAWWVRVCFHQTLYLRRLRKVHAFTAAELDDRSSISTHVSPSPFVGPPCTGQNSLSLTQGRLRLRGRQPLCGVGVSSMMVRTLTPVAWIDLIACS